MFTLPNLEVKSQKEISKYVTRSAFVPFPKFTVLINNYHGPYKKELRVFLRLVSGFVNFNLGTSHQGIFYFILFFMNISLGRY